MTIGELVIQIRDKEVVDAIAGEIIDTDDDVSIVRWLGDENESIVATKDLKSLNEFAAGLRI